MTILLFWTSFVHAQDSAIVMGAVGYNFLEDTIKPQFDSLYRTRLCNFDPINLADTNIDSLWVNDTLISPAWLWMLSESSLTDPNYTETVNYIYANNKQKYFTVKKVKIIWKKP